MHDFQILFDHGERSELLDPVYSRYGKLGFPQTPPERPWIYANFVQTLDGITSLLGKNASGGDIAQSEEDRWLMDLLRAHADAVLIGSGTLILETRLQRPRPRGPVFRIVEPVLQQLRVKLHKGREKNIIVSGKGNLNLSDFAVFDGDKLDAAILTSEEGERRLRPQVADRPNVSLIVAGSGPLVDLQVAMKKLREEHGIRRLLCEGGPQLYSSMLHNALIDEKFLTVAPVEVGQERPPEQEQVSWEESRLRPTVIQGRGFTKESAPRWEWISCRKVGSYQFNRYRRVT